MTGDSLGQFEVGCAAHRVHGTIMYTALQPSPREFFRSVTIWLLAYQSVLLYSEGPDQKAEADCQAREASSSDGCAATQCHCTKQQMPGCPHCIFGYS